MAEQTVADMAVQARSFGAVAEVYDSSRLDYPDEMVDEVLDYARLGDAPAVEIGAGTGKATLPFAARGTALTCLEPDPQMAAVLRRKLDSAGVSDAAVVESVFEEWQPGGRRFGLLLAATSWHWVDRSRAWGLAHAALAPGGAVALIWGNCAVVDPEVHARLAEVDAPYPGLDAPHSRLASDAAALTARLADREGWAENTCRADGRFTDFVTKLYTAPIRFSTERYLGYLDSISRYRVLPEGHRRRVLAATAEVLETDGGGIDMLATHLLFRARAV